MRNYTLENYEDQMNKQVVHMDQAVSYCPEFRATKMMHDYPSRKLQLARAVYKGELEANEYITNILLNSILSRQGERWQNFGENPEDFTDAMILSREMMIKKGFGKEIVNQLKAIIDKNCGHIVEVNPDKDIKWRKYIPVAENSSVYLMLDDATYAYASESARSLGEFFSKKDIRFYPEIKATFPGWEYFAYGLVEEGYNYLTNMIEGLKGTGIDTIVTLTGQTHYIWKVLVKKFGLVHNFKIMSVLDYCEQLKVDVPVYLYAGSFFARYLRMEDEINKLIINEKEELIKNCAEFTPLLIADKRINKVTIWQKPVSAEYLLLGLAENIENYIKNDAIEDIKKGTQRETIVFDPYAYNVLCEEIGEKKVSYYIDKLS
ncbi:MAG: hypothetical protein CVV02_11625 [Firmicutes bacterium HGW-Firmicutes-7]|nr:MAG: hypothetical protein CVV02_11625 [Firmicutes bacterium HGW-Firmicutes-7]